MVGATLLPKSNVHLSDDDLTEQMSCLIVEKRARKFEYVSDGDIGSKSTVLWSWVLAVHFRLEEQLS